MKNIFYILGILFATINIADAQKIYPEDGISKFSNGGLLVKWQPKSVEEWKASYQNGYTISVISKGKELVSKTVKPSSYEQIIQQSNAKSPFLRQFYIGAADFLYPDNALEKNKVSNIFENQTSKTESQWNLAFLLYSCIYDFNLAQLAGLGVKFEGIANGEYSIRIETKGYTSFYVKHIPNMKEKSLSKPNVEWGDKIMEVSWDTKDLTKNYYGYILQKSVDGRIFTQSDSIPYVNNQEGEDNNESAFIMKAKDSLEFNNRTYYFRLRGMDYFGEWSETFVEFSGQGIDALNQSPVIIYADQLENNDAHLKWKFPERDVKLLKHFVMYRADSIDGEYTIFKDSIDIFKREIKFPLKHTQNFFRIVAIPQKGQEVGSMPVLVMGQDNDPPQKAQVLSATVDNKGYVVITIKKNTEKDLWGYRLFKSNFKSDEFSLMNASPKLDTVFRDTINLKLGTENIFYFIEVADLRNNRSPLSDTIKLKIPDIIPPNPPIIQKLVQLSDTLKIIWVNSNSKDVVNQSIFRREIYKEDSWTKIFQFDTSYHSSEYIDLNIKVGSTYAYTMTAIDEVGLESKPIDNKQITIREVEKEFIPFDSIKYEIINDEKNIKLTWMCKDLDELESVLIYKGYDKDKLNRYEEIDAPQFYLEDDYISGQNVYYLIKPRYKVKKGIIKNQEIIEVISKTNNINKE